MEVLEYAPDKTTRFAFPWKPLTIKPLGDIQFGNAACDVSLLKKEVEEALEQDAYFIGMGDYCDVGSPSNRKQWAKAKEDMYDSFREAVEEKIAEHEEGLYEILKPTKGRWLGMLSGHHYWEYEDGTTTDTSLASRLKARHLGDCAMVRLQFADQVGASGRPVQSIGYTIWGHHGAGSGITIGAPLNKLERVITWVEADLYLMGHQHKRVEAPIPRFYLTASKNPILVAKEKRLVCCGSFLKGYMQGSKTRTGIAVGTYVEKAMMTPVALGAPIIHIMPRDRAKQGQTIREVVTKVIT